MLKHDDLRCTGDIEGSKEPCSNCKRADIPCIKATKRLRFRNVAKPKKASGFASDQPWLQTSSTLSFLDETAEVAQASSGSANLNQPEQVLPPSNHSFVALGGTATLSPVCSNVPPHAELVASSTTSMAPQDATHIVENNHTVTTRNHQPSGDTIGVNETLSHAIVGLSPKTIIAATPSPAATPGESMEDD